MKLFHFSLFSLLLTPAIVAADQSITTTTTSPNLAELSTPIPENCGQEGVVYQNGQLILGTTNNTNEQPIYIIRNNSDYPQISLMRYMENPISAAWVSRLDEGKWSSLSVSRPNLVFNCLGRKPGAIGYVDCASVLLVCSYPRGKMSSGGGSFFIAENRPLFDVLNCLKERGVTIPSS